MEAAYTAPIERLETEQAANDSINILTFDEDFNIQFGSIVSFAKLIGANTERLVDLKADTALLTNGKPVVP